MSDTIDAYAAALLAVLRAEGDTGADDEILRFAHRLRATNGPPPERAAGAA